MPGKQTLKQKVGVATVRSICARLQREYNSPRLGNPTDPVDDLFFIILSNRTGPRTARRVYDHLRERYPIWDRLVAVRRDRLAKILVPLGLPNVRAGHLLSIVRQLRADFGHVTLTPLQNLPDYTLEDYLTSLAGVSKKVAKCVMLYGFDRQTLPVDVHVHRVSERLGWHNHSRADQCHDTLELLVPPQLRYGFHTNCIAHGRMICRAMPRCGECSLLDLCPTGASWTSAKSR